MNVNLSTLPLNLADDPLSTDCYSVRLLLEFLQLPYQSVYADVEQFDNKFESPVLLDSSSNISGLMFIFQYLIELTGTQSQWIPVYLSSQIQDWHDFNEKLKLSLGQLRQASLAVDQFLTDEKRLFKQAAQQLRELDDHLCEQTICGHRYLLGGQLTAADLIVFPQVALAWDAGVSLLPFLHIRRWINHIRHQPKFIPMAGLLAIN
ncbi:glutathione S-transferase family protein [Acinetobacter proteolyticus]|uniref:Glutathione S-transferase n=1 Tax=Acinetobacter proteolyticus TaxID=1776741 RepID=A0A2N0WDL7_9GAMM|nr:glutathione S-transferase [Acinetobacter proteolyticus]MBK5648365.1 glutathione S-transferase family protein [Acinetobacter sp.]PKF32800.1 glutathione S-transferase [Acinetobacter proteolyticus]